MSLFPQQSSYQQSRPAILQKTRMCQYHLAHRCRYGSACSFAHSPLELRLAPASVRKTKLCPLFEAGFCLDATCNYAHGVDELRFGPVHAFPHYASPPAVSDTPDETSNYPDLLLLNMLNHLLAEQQTQTPPAPSSSAASPNQGLLSFSI